MQDKLTDLGAEVVAPPSELQGGAAGMFWRFLVADDYSRPFPTQRDENHQHVGQVFDHQDNPRMGDIDGFIRGKPNPVQCTKIGFMAELTKTIPTYKCTTPILDNTFLFTMPQQLY